jgi:hypothetical protein
MAADANPRLRFGVSISMDRPFEEVLGTLMLVIMLSVLGMMMTMGLGDPGEVSCHKGRDNCLLFPACKWGEGAGAEDFQK